MALFRLMIAILKEWRRSIGGKITAEEWEVIILLFLYKSNKRVSYISQDKSLIPTYLPACYFQ